MFLVHVLEMVASAATRIWSAGSVDQFLTLCVGWGVGTTLLFAPAYAIAWVLPGMAGMKAPKWLGKIRNWILLAHMAVTLAPILLVPGICCVMPCALLWWVARAIYRGNRPQPQRRPRRRPARRPEPEDEDDEDTDGGD